PGGGLRGARDRPAHPPPPALPGDRRLGALGRGDRDADHPARRGAGAAGRRGGVVSRGPTAKYGPVAWGVRRDMSEKGWVPLRYWLTWWTAMAAAVVLFYVIL